MTNLVERAVWAQVRVGGNTQENAEVESLPNGSQSSKNETLPVSKRFSELLAI
jgi:hypothetical protein